MNSFIQLEPGKPRDIVFYELPSSPGHTTAFIDQLIHSILGPPINVSQHHDQPALATADASDIADAIANVITDITLSEEGMVELDSQRKVNKC